MKKLTIFMCLLLAGVSGNVLAATKDSSKVEIKKCETQYKNDAVKEKACIAKVKKALKASKVAKSNTSTSVEPKTAKAQIKKCETQYKSDAKQKKACIDKVKKMQTTSSSKMAESKAQIKKCETQYKSDAKQKKACIDKVKKMQTTSSSKMAESKAQIKKCETQYKSDAKQKMACIDKVDKMQAKKMDSNKAMLAQTEKISKKVLKSININTATAAEMASSLPGVGDTKAKAIVDYRKQYGKFKSASDLAKVKGLGEKSVAKMSNYITY